MIYKLVKYVYQSVSKIERKISRSYWTWRAKMSCHSYTPPLKAGFQCKFSKNTFLGKNTSFNGFEVAGTGKVVIGDNFHCGKNCKIINSFHNFRGTLLPYDKTFIVKDVTIGANVWLGDDVIILGGANIGEGAIIQAGSVVVKDIPPLALAGGHPAVAFKYRDKEHYERLKAAGQFL